MADNPVMDMTPGSGEAMSGFVEALRLAARRDETRREAERRAVAPPLERLPYDWNEADSELDARRRQISGKKTRGPDEGLEHVVHPPPVPAMVDDALGLHDAAAILEYASSPDAWADYNQAVTEIAPRGRDGSKHSPIPHPPPGVPAPYFNLPPELRAPVEEAVWWNLHTLIRPFQSDYDGGVSVEDVRRSWGRWAPGEHGGVTSVYSALERAMCPAIANFDAGQHMHVHNDLHPRTGRWCVMSGVYYVGAWHPDDGGAFVTFPMVRDPHAATGRSWAERRWPVWPNSLLSFPLWRGHRAGDLAEGRRLAVRFAICFDRARTVPAPRAA